MSSPRLELVTPENVVDACDLRVRPDQEGVVAPVAQSLAEAYAGVRFYLKLGFRPTGQTFHGQIVAERFLT